MAKNEIDDLMKASGAISGSQFEKFTGNLPVLSTGIFAVDLATGAIDPTEGTGGIRARDLWEVCGENGCGKSALANSFIATTQRRYPGRSVIGLFSEPPDIGRMRREGVDIDNLIILGCYHDEVQEKHLLAESALQALLDFSKLDQIKACVIDSVAALSAETEMFNPNGKERDLFDSQPVAGLAKIFNKFVKDFTSTTKVASLLMVNHYRQAITTGPSFVAPSMLRLQTPGGRSKEFLSNIRILATANPLWKDKGAKHSATGARVQEGMEVNYKIFKNKYANPDSHRLAKVNFNFEESNFTNAESILNFALFFTYRDENGKVKSIIDPIVSQNSSWINIGEEKFQGMDKAADFLKKNYSIMNRIEKQLIPLANKYYGDKKDFSAEEALG